MQRIPRLIRHSLGAICLLFGFSITLVLQWKALELQELLPPPANTTRVELAQTWDVNYSNRFLDLKLIFRNDSRRPRNR